jgi:hypothetical protein
MPANSDPIYSRVGDVQWGTTALTAANTAKDGTGTTLLVFTADSTNGGFVQKLRIRAAGTNVASVARIFINNGSSSATPANNILFDEISLPATTISEVAALANLEVPLNFALPAGYTIRIAQGTAVAAGYYYTCVGGKY